MEKKKKQVRKDLENNGRDIAYLDEDRIINEGLSGGSVHSRGNVTNIEEARDLHEEEPPYEA